MTTKTIARFVTIGALFIIPFLSLVVFNSFYFPFITGKNFAFRILVEIALAGWLILAASDKRYRIRFSWVLVLYAAFVAWLGIATITAVSSHKAVWSNFERMDGWITLIHLLVFMVVLTGVLSTENLWRKWWLAFIGGAGLVCVRGLFQLAGLSAIHQGSTRIDATLGNAEYLAGYMLFAIAITLWQAFETRDKEYVWLKYSLFVLSVIELVILFATGTRGTLIALVVAAAIASILWMVEAGKQGRKGAIAAFAVIVLLVGGLFVARNATFVQQSPNLQRLASVFSLKQALGPRITIWHMAIEGIEEKPILGWGQEGFNYVFNKYYEPSLYGQEPWFDRAHNLFLDWGIAGGLPAMLLFIALLISAVRAFYKAPISRHERILLLSALAGYAVQGLVVFDNLFTYIPFVALLALAHWVSSKPIKAFEEGSEVNDVKLDSIIAPGAVILAGLLIWFVNVPSVRAAGDLITALNPSGSVSERLSDFKKAVDDKSFAHQEITEQLMTFTPQIVTDQSTSNDDKQAVATYANQEMITQLKSTPQDARLLLQYANFLRALGVIGEAQTQSALARSFSPTKQSIIIEQGMEAFQTGQYPAAQKFFTNAYTLDTNYREPIVYLAATHIIQKDVAGGKKILQEGYGTTVVNHPILLYAYYQIQDWNDLIDVIKAKLKDSNDATTGFQLAAAYSQAGRRAEAVAQVRATIALHPDAAAQGEQLLTQLGVSQ